MTEYTELIIKALKSPTKSEVAINQAIERLTELDAISVALETMPAGEKMYIVPENGKWFYGEIDVQEAVEKQIAKPMNIANDSRYKYGCPTCGWFFSFKNLYCPRCGQKLQTGYENEK